MTIINGVKNKTLMPGVTPIADVVDAPTIGTATAGIESATVAFTAVATGGAATSFTAISTPGSITGSSATSPITVSGLTADTAYTFKVYGANASGTWSNVQSAASNSVTVLGTSFESIASVTATGGETSFTFSSIPSTYQHLQIRGKAQYNNANGPASLQLRFNSNTGSNYAMHFLRGNGSTTYVQGNASSTRILLDTATFSNGAGDYFGSSIVDIHDYANTSKNKTVRYFAGSDSNNTNGGQVSIGSGLFISTSAISSIEIAVDSSYTFQSGTVFSLYGIKGA